MFNKENVRYMNNIVTGNETWLYYYDMLTKSQNKVSTFEDEDVHVANKNLRSVKKKMITAIFKLKSSNL